MDPIDAKLAGAITLQARVAQAERARLRNAQRSWWFGHVTLALALAKIERFAMAGYAHAVLRMPRGPGGAQRRTWLVLELTALGFEVDGGDHVGSYRVYW